MHTLIGFLLIWGSLIVVNVLFAAFATFLCRAANAWMVKKYNFS